MEKVKKTLNKHSLWPLWPIGASLLLILWSMLLWQWSITHSWLVQTETNLFLRLNKTLLDYPSTQYFWGMLNHRREVWLNLIVAIGLNLWSVVLVPKEKRVLQCIRCCYFWAFFEIALWIQDYLIVHMLDIARASPSLVLKPYVLLSESLHNTRIIDSSSTSFPSGHAFALLYWALFTAYLGPRKISLTALFIGIFLCLPRLFSGAHWLTDSVFSLWMALFVFTLAKGTPLYHVCKKIAGRFER